MTSQQLLSPGNLHQWACCRNKQQLCCPTNYKFPNTMWQSARSSIEAILWAASTFLRNGLSSFHLNGVRLVTNHCRLTCHPAKNLTKNQPSLLELKLETTCKVYGTNIGQSLNTKHKKCQEIPVLNLCCHCHESLLHINCIFGTGLQEWDANFISKSL